jgi:hypothetical protein
MTWRHIATVRDRPVPQHHHGVHRDHGGGRHRHDRQQDHAARRAGGNADERGHERGRRQAEE